MKLISIVGARPNFVKMAPLLKLINNSNHDHLLVHTGQHYDFNMSNIFFEEMDLIKPDYNLDVGSGSHAYQTAEILMGIEKICLGEEPDIVIVPGDTNSTLAAALAIAKIDFRLAHLEAGLRSYDKTMPEEINRILTDHCSDILFCPTQTAVKNLHKEGITSDVHYVGDTMFEIYVKVKDKVEDVALDFPLPSEYLLATIHRAENTASSNLKTIFDSLCNIDHKIIIPLHPRTKKRLKEEKLFDFVNSHLIIIDPLGYLHFTKLLQNAKAVITDSGGVQKEAYWNHVPCVTVRDNTEWIETVNANGNILSQPSEIGEKLNYMLSRNISFNDNLYGFDDTSRRILTILENFEE